MEFLKVSWPEVQKLCEQLSGKISAYKPDILVGISRGGLVPVRLISDILGISEVTIMRIEFYKTIAKTNGFPEITQPLQIDVKGKKILVVDDVSDTGRSLAVAKEHIHKKGASEVRFATLHFKPKSAFKPDYYIGETNKWIIYPWETNETKREIAKLEER